MLPIRATEYAGWTQVWAPAKVNLYLRVVSRRLDGYHELATLMVPVPLYDTILLRAETSLSLACDSADLAVNEHNLVLRAALLLRDRFATGRGAFIQLRKRIPKEAGMGGGSSDAAATLVGLNQLWNLQLGTESLIQLAMELGSDVPFFLGEGTAWCTGRGEILKQITYLQEGLHLVVVKPEKGLVTREIFNLLNIGTIHADLEDSDGIFLRSLTEGPYRLSECLRNDLARPALELLPMLGDIRQSLLASGALGVVMTGSGSAMVGLAGSAAGAARLAREVRSARTPGGPVRVFVCSPSGMALARRD